MNSDDESDDIVPQQIRDAAKILIVDLLPAKSKRLYVSAYNEFKKWRKDQKSNSFCEDVMLVYFNWLSKVKNFAPTSLWAVFSMLKTTINTFDNINIGSYKKLTYFLKQKSSEYQPKKSKEFTSEEITKFLNEAPDALYFTTKIACIFGIAGGLRREEFAKVTLADVKDYEDMFVVTIPKTKTKVSRRFTISDDFYKICKRYLQARPPNCILDRFFLRYSQGKFINQPVGINRFAAMPKDIALYLSLPEPDKYTGHSFRRTSATILVDNGADITTLKRHGAWKSDQVAYGYIAESVNNKKRTEKLISNNINLNNEVLFGSDESTSANVVNASGTVALPKQVNHVQSDEEFEKIDIESTDFAEDFERSIEPVNNENQLANKDQMMIDQSAKNVPSVEIENISCTPSKVRRTEFHEPEPHSSSKDLFPKVVQKSSYISSKVSQSEFCEQKYSIFYDPAVGLYYNEQNLNKSFVLNNCQVTIQVPCKNQQKDIEK